MIRSHFGSSRHLGSNAHSRASSRGPPAVDELLLCSPVATPPMPAMDVTGAACAASDVFVCDASVGKEFASANSSDDEGDMPKDDSPATKKPKNDGAHSDAAGLAASGSSVPAPDPAAVAAPPAPMTLDSLATMMFNLMHKMDVIDAKMDTKMGVIDAKMDTKMDAIDAKVDKLDSKLFSPVELLDSRFEVFKDEVNARFEALQLGPAAAAHASTPIHAGSGLPKASWSKSAGGASSRGPPAPSPARTTTAGSPSASSPSADEAGRKIIAIGFPRTLPRPALIGWWETVRLRLPLDIQCKGTFQGGTGKAFSVVFPCRDDARAFTTHISTNQTLFNWTSPRKDEQPFPINFKTERTIEEKDRGRALSGAWLLLSPLIKDSKAFDKDQMKFVTDPRRGTIAVATGLDMWTLVQLRANNDSFSITTDPKSFAFFGIDEKVAEAVRTSVAAPRASQ